MSPACTCTKRMGNYCLVALATSPRSTCGRVLMTNTVSTQNHTNAFTSPSSPWSPAQLAVFHEDTVRLLYHVATIQASSNVDNEGLIGRGRQDHRFGLRRASIFRRLQADLGSSSAPSSSAKPAPCWN